MLSRIFYFKKEVTTLPHKFIDIVPLLGTTLHNATLIREIKSYKKIYPGYKSEHLIRRVLVSCTKCGREYEMTLSHFRNRKAGDGCLRCKGGRSTMYHLEDSRLGKIGFSASECKILVELYWNLIQRYHEDPDDKLLKRLRFRAMNADVLILPACNTIIPLRLTKKLLDDKEKVAHCASMIQFSVEECILRNN
jgi:hypothetical protein